MHYSLPSSFTHTHTHTHAHTHTHSEGNNEHNKEEVCCRKKNWILLKNFLIGDLTLSLITHVNSDK